MKEDVRDRSLGQALDGVVRGVGPSVDRLPEIRRRGTRRRAVQWTAVVAALATFTGAVGWAALSRRPPESTPLSSLTRMYADPPNGWSFRYPRAWRVQPFESPCHAAPAGVLITNDPRPFTRSPGACGGWDFTAHPEGVVLIQVIHAPFPGGEPQDTRFPLKLARFARPSLLGGTSDPTDQWGLNVVQGGRYTYQVWLWFGRRASRDDRRLAATTLASLRLGASGHRVPRLGLCPSASEVAALSSRLAVRGDLDGDGRADLAWVMDVPGYPEACSRFVVVEDARGKRTGARVPEWWAPQLPMIAGLARIDSAPGAEVVATFDAGGFSRQVALFSVRDGRLVPLRIFEMLLVADARREAANLDCVSPGEIVWGTTGSRRGASTDVLRRFYRLHGTRFQLEFRKTERSHVPTSWIGTRRMLAVAPELADLSRIFPSCSATR